MVFFSRSVIKRVGRELERELVKNNMTYEPTASYDLPPGLYGIYIFFSLSMLPPGGRRYAFHSYSYQFQNKIFKIPPATRVQH